MIFYTAGNINLTCTGPGGVSGTASATVSARSADHLLIVMPGQTYAPGFVPGSYPYVTILAGSYYQVTVYVVDSYNNWVDPYSDSIYVYSVAPITLSSPNNVPITNGRAIFTLAVQEKGSGISLVASGNTLSGNATFNVISPTEAWIHLLVPNQVVAGHYFTVTANATSLAGDPYALLGSTSADFELKRFIAGSTDAAIGTWVGPTTFAIRNSGGTYAGNSFAYQKAESIVLRADVTGGGYMPPSITSVTSSVIQVLPNLPASVQVTLSPSQIQSKHSSRINVTVLDQFGNPTRSSLYPFVVTFAQVQGNGYLSVTQTATDNRGLAWSDYTGGIINETAQVGIAVRHAHTGETYASATASVQVSVARVEAGSIVNFPNPFNPAKGQTTAINYYLGSPSNVDIKIYDPFGRLVLARSFSKDDPLSGPATQAGGALWNWDGRNGAGQLVGNGIYLVKIVGHGDQEQTFQRRVGVVK